MDGNIKFLWRRHFFIRLKVCVPESHKECVPKKGNGRCLTIGGHLHYAIVMKNNDPIHI